MPRRFQIIDGYNVLHSCGLIQASASGSNLQNARKRFLDLLVRHLDPKWRESTTVVFDSAVSSEQQQTVVEGILVEFAADHPSADARIIERIRQHSSPRQLLVVSSDREIQRAASARGARAIQSPDWFDWLLSARQDKSRETADPEIAARHRKLNRENVQYWMSLMSDEEPVPGHNPPRDRPPHTSLPDSQVRHEDLFPEEMLRELRKWMEEDQETP